ncbi:methionine-glutamine aminotransferase [Microbacterium sediminicola]|uniref:Methionine-glutamine aminotransferase n=2 Tax=Microbacterium sediminicola TaxID=415210 RepID=A0ABN2IJU7_9MICO
MPERTPPVHFAPAARVDALPLNFWDAIDREVARLSAEPGPRMIDVSKGSPDLPTPPHIVQAMQRAVANPSHHRYNAFTGYAPLREAIAMRYREDHGVDLDPDSQVVTFSGSHEALMAAIIALADPGSTVVLPDPGYPMYFSGVDLAGATIATLPLVEPGYAPDFDALRDLDEARVLMLNYPNNPTGAVATRQIFEDALTFSRRVGAAFIHDFAYSALGAGGSRPLSALSVDRDTERTVELQTVSKTYSMAGWRVGYAAGNPSIIDAMRRYQAHAYSLIFGATQEAAAAALTGDQSVVDEIVAVYERRRTIVVDGLRAIGWDVIDSVGTFFVWVRISGDAVEFARILREEARVAVGPGDGFGSRGRGHIRLGLTLDDDTLREMIDRLAQITLPTVSIR